MSSTTDLSMQTNTMIIAVGSCSGHFINNDG